MQTVRRVYLYAVAFISFQTCLWAAVGLALMVIDPPPPGSLLIIRLAGLLSALIVAVPFYLIHWVIAQRLATENSDERSSNARSLYHYGLMLATAAPIIGSGAFVLKDLISLLLGAPVAVSTHDVVDSILRRVVIIAINSATWYYARRHAAADHQAIPEQGGRQTIHRVYRYLFVACGLALTAAGVGLLLVLMLEPSGSVGDYWRTVLAQGLTNLLVGASLWVVNWLAAQRAFATGGEEAESTLRKGYLYLVSLIGCLVSLNAAATLLSRLLQRALGVPARGMPLMADLSNPMAVIIVAAVIWIYHGKILSSDADKMAEETRQRGLRRLYYYLLASVGLVATLLGAFGLIGVLASALGGAAFASLRVELSNSLAYLAAGLPLWLVPWMRVQLTSQTSDETGDEARSSLVRRIYLYIFVFVGVIGVLISGAGLINLMLRWMLGALPATPLLQLVQNSLALALTSATLAYHLWIILGDGKRQRISRAEALFAFPVALIGPSSWTEELEVVLRRMLPGMPFRTGQARQAKGLLGGMKAVVLPSTVLAADGGLRKVLDAFDGLRLIVPHDQPGWAWVGTPPQESIWKEAQDVGPLLEMAALGEPPRARRGLGAWGVVGVVLAILLALFVLLPIVITFSLP